MGDFIIINGSYTLPSHTYDEVQNVYLCVLNSGGLRVCKCIDNTTERGVWQHVDTGTIESNPVMAYKHLIVPDFILALCKTNRVDYFENLCQTVNLANLEEPYHNALSAMKDCYNYYKHNLYMIDAKSHADNYISYKNIAVELSDVDYSIMATQFDDTHDCNVSDNAAWETIVKEYIDDLTKNQ